MVEIKELPKNLQLTPNQIDTIVDKNVNPIDLTKWRIQIAEESKKTFDKLNDPEQIKKWNSIYKL
jgi:hypothetical protein